MVKVKVYDGKKLLTTHKYNTRQEAISCAQVLHNYHNDPVAVKSNVNNVEKVNIAVIGGYKTIVE